MCGYIYKTTNKINNKIYIGQHKTNKDSIDEKYYGSGTLITESIEKYGKENFEVEILEWCETEEELNNKEIYWIKVFNSTDRKIGYNIKYGGNSHPFPKVIKEKISKALMGKKKSKTACDNMRKAKIGTTHDGWNKSRVWVNNKEKEFLIKTTDIDDYIQNGYTFGRIEYDINWEEKYNNRMFINNGINEKNIYIEEYEKYKLLGWVEGRVQKQYSSERNLKISQTKKNRIKISNGENVKFIKEEDLELYTNLGYKRTKNTIN